MDVLVLWYPLGVAAERICGRRDLLSLGLPKILRGYCVYFHVVI